jgi:hypothetical protein
MIQGYVQYIVHDHTVYVHNKFAVLLLIKIKNTKGIKVVLVTNYIRYVVSRQNTVIHLGACSAKKSSKYYCKYLTSR